MKQSFYVEISERRVFSVTIQAKSAEEAEAEAKELYLAGELSPGFCHSEMTVVPHPAGKAA